MEMKEKDKGDKKVLLLIPSFADEGGTQKMVYELGILLSEKYEVFECSFDAYNEGHTFKNGNKILSLDSPEDKGAFRKVIGYCKKAKRLRQLIRQHNIDVTISNLWAADLVNALSRTSEKKIAVIHSSIEGDKHNRLLLKLHRIVRPVYRSFNAVVGVNENLKTEADRLFGLSSLRSVCIHNFIEPKENKVGLPPTGRLRLVTCGRLTQMKNIGFLLPLLKRLLATFPDLQLVIIGEGESKAQLIAKASTLGLAVGNDPLSGAEVVFTGFLSEPHSVFQTADLFVFPSKAEGFGLVILEAMNAGLPVIASDCPSGGPFVILQGSGRYREGRAEREETPCGVLMPVPCNSNAQHLNQWSDAVADLLRNDEKRRSMGSSATRRASDFSKEKVGSRWFQLIETV